MKYIWIVMLALVEIVWILLSIIDMYLTVSTFGIETDWDDFADTTKLFITTHSIGLFVFSLLTWFGA